MFIIAAVAALTALYVVLARAGSKRLCRERKELPPIKRLPMVSVIIAAYKSQKTITHTLKSASLLDYPRKEIIVVNDSRDSTPAIARSYGAAVIQNPERIGKPTSLNMATERARGEILFFLDSDTVVSRDCLKKAIPWFSRKDVAAVMPRYLLRNRRRISRLASLENLFTFAMLYMHMFFGTMVGFRGCSVLIRKSILVKHPWPDTLMEDNHLSATLASRGHAIIWEPLALTWTDEPESMADLKRQKRRWGEGAYLTFRHHRRFYLKSPQFMVYLFPYFALGVAAGLLVLSLLLSPLMFPGLTMPIAIELISVFVAMYFHSLILFFVGSGEFLPGRTLSFMVIYFPVMTAYYFRGILSGIKRKKQGKRELHFRHW